MGFLSKFKRGARQGAGKSDSQSFDEVFDGIDPALPNADGAATLDTAAMAPTLGTHEVSSIISEAAPFELQGDFSETRVQDNSIAPAAVATGSGLPMIGAWPIADQQRTLGGLLFLGLLGLATMAVISLNSATRGATQVAASGQALTQSQRLAKSVSQALIGNVVAFPEVKDSTGMLASNVRGLQHGSDSVAAVSGAVQTSLGPITPLVDRAEKNAHIVLSQEKILTQVGQALRTINRQSSDLLEVAETVASLKLQQDASAAEISAAGQLVMLTQRIGKSANEFLTVEGVSPEAVFLLGKDLNAFREIAKGLRDGSPELRLPPTK
ncbi:MAG: methyl-accepting chemotaxis sensory transducer, partial [Pseudomonadota bacterium]